jgi:hypothetical protein
MTPLCDPGATGSAVQRQLYAWPGRPPSGGVSHRNSLSSFAACLSRTLASSRDRQM